jgi:hypothetical protein
VDGHEPNSPPGGVSVAGSPSTASPGTPTGEPAPAPAPPQADDAAPPGEGAPSLAQGASPLAQGASPPAGAEASAPADTAVAPPVAPPIDTLGPPPVETVAPPPADAAEPPRVEASGTRGPAPGPVETPAPPASTPASSELPAMRASTPSASAADSPRTSTPSATEMSSTRTSTPSATEVSSTRTSTPSSLETSGPRVSAPPAETALARTSAPPASETPQTTSIAPALSAPDRSLATARRPGWRRRAVLAVLGALAALGALAFPFMMRARGEPSPGVSKAASMAATVSAAAVTRADEGGAGGDDGGADDDAAPPKPAVWRVARMADDPTVSLVEGTMGKRPLLAALGAAGVPRAEAHRIVSSLQEARDVDHFDPKDAFAVARDKASGRVVAFEVSTSPVDVWQARDDVALDGAPRLVTRRLELVAERVRIRKAVLVGADLRASFVDAGFAPIDDVLSMLDDALDGHAELSDIRPGARLRIVATLERVDGAFVRWESLDAVEYLPAAPGAPAVRVYWFGEDDRRHGWYDAKGRQPTHGGWRMPIPLAHVVSPFNPHRMHPVLHVVMPHNGVDLRATTGTPVYATAAGVVIGVGNDGPCGNKVEISHPGNITSVYCHLSRFATGLHSGEHVEARQLIAYVGQTGRVTGPHLHFGIKRGGQFIDPMTLRMESMRVVPRSRRDEFDRLRTSLDGELDTIPLPAPAGAEQPPPKEETETFYEEP